MLDTRISPAGDQFESIDLWTSSAGMPSVRAWPEHEVQVAAAWKIAHHQVTSSNYKSKFCEHEGQSDTGQERGHVRSLALLNHRSRICTYKVLTTCFSGCAGQLVEYGIEYGGVK